MSEQLIKTPGTFGDNGNFLLERELGAGGMGGVYLGRDKMLDRPVAVKVMTKELGSDAEFVEKFKKEAQAVARLIHPNISQVYSYGISDGMPYIAMELCAGGSLYSLMNASPGKTDVQRCLKICQQTAMALQCATDQGFVHGDVKPENILLDANGNAKLVDFGLAAMQKDTNEIWGTPYYISPEKVKKEPVDFRADMYSLGGTLYHALTGVAPFEGDDSVAVVKKRFEGMPKKPSELRPEITPAVDNLVMTMLALNKEDRYPSFEALLQAFTDVLTSGLSKTGVITQTNRVTRTGAMGRTGKTGRVMATGATRRATMKRPMTTSKVTPATESAEANTPDDEEKEEGGNLGKKVILSVVGGILAIGAVVGGLCWYVSASEAADREAKQAEITKTISKARESISDISAKATKFDVEFQDFAAKATLECTKITDQLKKLLPDYAAQMQPAISDELRAAIALTNTVAAVAPQPPEPAPAPAAAPAQTNTAEVASAPTAPAEASAKTDNTPTVIGELHDLWERAYSCQASQIKISVAAKKVLTEAEKAAQLTGNDEATMQALATVASAAKDLYEQMTGSKDVENVKKGIQFIKSKGEKIVKQTVRRLTIEKAEANRAAKKAEQERLDKEREEQRLKELAQLVASECQTMTNRFDEIVAQGCMRQLDWHSAISGLERSAQEFKTEEGRQALKFQLKKVEQMKSVQDLFIKKLKDYTFKSNIKKGGLKGAKVTKIDEKELTIQKTDKKTVKVSWQKFYKEYPGFFNEIINTFIEKGRQNSGLNLMQWKDVMTGAALTMRLVCSDVNGATAKAEMLAKEVVKQEPEYLKLMQDVFPDITFDVTEE